MAAKADPAADHSSCFAAATAVHSNILESLAKRPDRLTPNIQQTFDRDEQPDISDLKDEKGKSAPPVITMQDTTWLGGSFMVPPSAQLHRPNRWVLLILVIGVVTAIAYYLDRHSGLLTGEVLADKDRTFPAMKDDETSRPRPIQSAKTAAPLGRLPESPPGDVPGVALRDEGDSAMDEKADLERSTIVPTKDTAGDMAASLAKGPLRPAGREDGVGQSRTLPRERAADDRNDVLAAPHVSTFPIEPGQTTAQATTKRERAKDTGDHRARGTSRALEDKGAPTPSNERTRLQRICSEHERILGLCN
jgi:hypothetical protein